MTAGASVFLSISLAVVLWAARLMWVLESLHARCGRLEALLLEATAAPEDPALTAVLARRGRRGHPLTAGRGGGTIAADDLTRGVDRARAAVAARGN